MPYSSNAELPEGIRKLPDHQQTVWRAAFNAALEDGKTEEEAFRIALAAAEGSGHGQQMMQGGVILEAIDLKNLVTRDLESESEVELARPGHYVQNGREFDITLQDFADAARNFAAAENPLPVDYEHNTFVKGAEAPAAGWIKRIVDKGAEGLWAVVSWTKSAAEKIRAGEYRFISPVFFFDAEDTKTGESIGTLLGPPALTNFPLIQGLEPLTASRINEKSKIDKEKNIMSEFLKKLFAALGIEAGEEIEEEKAIEMIVAKMAAAAEPPKRPKAVVPPAILKALDLEESASESEATGAIMALKYPSDTIPVERYQSLEQELRDREIADLIATACRPGPGDYEGKLYPHERDWALGEAKKDCDTMKAFIKHRPKVLSLMAKLPEGKKNEVVIDDMQASINRQLNVSKETFLKYNGRN